MQELWLQFKHFTDISFWIQLVERFKDFGPLAPITLALLESIFPALPLLVIISFNVGVYGPYLGFLYSWAGTTLGSILMFLFYRKLVKRYLHRWIMRQQKLASIHDWISSHKQITLFILTALPFTPSSLINLGYGLSDFSARTFVSTVLCSKLIMVFSMTMFGHSLVNMSEQPIFIIIAVILLIGLYYVSKFVSKKYLNQN